VLRKLHLHPPGQLPPAGARRSGMETRPLVADGKEHKGADGERGRSRGGPHAPPTPRGAGGGREGSGRRLELGGARHRPTPRGRRRRLSAPWICVARSTSEEPQNRSTRGEEEDPFARATAVVVEMLPRADRGRHQWRCCLAQIEVPAVRCPRAPLSVPRLVLAGAPSHEWRSPNHLQHARIWAVGHSLMSSEPVVASAAAVWARCPAAAWSCRRSRRGEHRRGGGGGGCRWAGAADLVVRRTAVGGGRRLRRRTRAPRQLECSKGRESQECTRWGLDAQNADRFIAVAGGGTV
jgi:hypothetical protein